MFSFDLVHAQPQLTSSQESESLLASREPIHEIYVEAEGFELPVVTLSGRIHDLFLERVYAQSDVLIGLQQVANEMSPLELKAFIKSHRRELIRKMNQFAANSSKPSQIRIISSDTKVQDVFELYAIASPSGKSDFYSFSAILEQSGSLRLELFSAPYTQKPITSGIIIAFPTTVGEARSLQRECEYVRELQCEDIPSIIDMRPAIFYPNELTWAPVALMEYCTAGSIATLEIAKCTECEKNDLIFKIAYAIAKMHVAERTHFDIRIENVLLTCTMGVMKVRFTNFTASRSEIGKYSPPEHISEGIPVNKYAIDMWQVADVLFFIRFGFSLFKKYLDGEPDLEKYRRCYADAERICTAAATRFDVFLLSLFSLDPLQRPTARELFSKVNELIIDSSLSGSLMHAQEEESDTCFCF